MKNIVLLTLSVTSFLISSNFNKSAQSITEYEILENISIHNSKESEYITQGTINPYNPQIINNFVTACVNNGGNIQFCSCAINEIRKKMTQEEYIEEELRMVNTGQMSEKMLKIVSQATSFCLK